MYLSDTVKQWMESLNLSTSERNGIVVLMLAILCMLGIRLYLVFWQPGLPISNMDAYRQEIAVFEADTLVELNTATIEQLVELPGIGPSFAERIVAYRDALGGFINAQQLMEIKGIGEAKMNGLVPYISIDSLKIVKLDINRAADSLLYMHPYADSAWVKLLISNRPYNAINGIPSIGLDKRIIPYLINP